MLSGRIAATAPFHAGSSFSPMFLPLKKLFVESCTSVLGLSLCICRVALFQNQSCSISEISEKNCQLWSTEFMLEIHTTGQQDVQFLIIVSLIVEICFFQCSYCVLTASIQPFMGIIRLTCHWELNKKLMQKCLLVHTGAEERSPNIYLLLKVYFFASALWQKVAKELPFWNVPLVVWLQ